MNPHRRLLGELGPTFRRDVQMAREYRRDLERLCLARHGEISVLHAHAIDCAAAFELHSSTCRWLIRTRLKDMTPSDVVVCSKAIAESKIKRNQQVALLKLDPPKADDDPLKTLYALPIPVLAEADPSPDAQDAPRAPAEPETVQGSRGAAAKAKTGHFRGLRGRLHRETSCDRRAYETDAPQGRYGRTVWAEGPRRLRSPLGQVASGNRLLS